MPGGPHPEPIWTRVHTRVRPWWVSKPVHLARSHYLVVAVQWSPDYLTFRVIRRAVLPYLLCVKAILVCEIILIALKISC